MFVDLLKKKSLIILFFTWSYSIFGQCLYQVSYYEALNKGKLDGFIPLSEVIKHGNTGIGGYHALDGEMILLNGKFYRIPASGKISSPKLTEKVCFAAVYDFKPQKNITIKGDSNLYKVIDRLYPDQETIIAIKVSGRFSYVKTRSVPLQKKPYPTLSEIVKTQTIFEEKSIEGTIIGIRTPAFMAGLNPVGYHLHFISDDESIGGHLLDVQLLNVSCEIMRLEEVVVKLPSE
jgi:acetolactate decarboxylase